MPRIIIVVLCLLMPGAMAMRKNIHLLQDLEQTQSLQEKNKDFTEAERKLHSGASLGVISERHTQTKVPLRKLLVALGAASVAAYTPHAALRHQPLAHVRPRQHGGGMGPAIVNMSSTPLADNLFDLDGHLDSNVMRYRGKDALNTLNADNLFDLDGHLDLPDGDVLSLERIKDTGLTGRGENSMFSLTAAEEAEFYSRFGPVALSEHLPESERRHHDDDMDLFYKNPDQDARTTLFLYTSTVGDHNGAFRMDQTLAFRMLQHSVGNNVAFKRVGSVQQAHEYMEQNQEKFGKIAHLVLGGHGNKHTLVLGDDEVGTNSYHPSQISVEHLLEPIKHLLELDGEHRSTVFLDSCSTACGLENRNLDEDWHHDPLWRGDLNIAMKVAQTLPGAKIYAFDEPAGIILLNPAFYRDGDFKVQSVLSSDPDKWQHPFVIEYSTEEEVQHWRGDKEEGRFHVERSLLQTDGAISQPDDGMGDILQGLTQEGCGAACGEQHCVARMFLSMEAATMRELADTAALPGVCVLFDTQESLATLASVVGGNDDMDVPALEADVDVEANEEEVD